MHARIKEDILEVTITYQEMLPLVLKHVEATTSYGRFPCLDILSPLLYSFLTLCHYLFSVYFVLGLLALLIILSLQIISGQHILEGVYK